MIFKWDTLLKGVVNSINTRFIRVFGFSPAQILLGFDPKYVPGIDEFGDIIRTEITTEEIGTQLQQQGMLAESIYEARLAKLDEIRQRAVQRRLDMGEELANKTDKVATPFAPGDLVRLRRLDQDGQKSHKLEPRWEGPPMLSQKSPRTISQSGLRSYIRRPSKGNST